MATQTINIKQDFSVPAQTVYNFCADHNRWQELMPIKVRRIKDGDTDINGVGSIRLLPIPLFPLEETIIKDINGERIEYTITKGVIAKSHYGIVQFLDGPNGTSSVLHTIDFESIIPFTTGPIVMGLKLSLGDFYKKLAKKLKQNPNF